ncbi:metalloprotease PmbA [Saccharobesus litoralis]|uniref:Metalloprotease PmbA n=1 Tax=Saccharobesus litoralis TaxID=2172099 RepID=A0A2S0VX49_9ALTE|nr:metalloprotease PmbA [Saccharobesus litoralis]AWB68796.1 metalloprotease PmbA [Saccharobesus litoralis]
MLDEMKRVESAVDNALAYAKSLGATSAEVSISKTQGLQVSSRLGEVETVEFNHDGALGIALWNGQRKGSASTSDLSKAAIEQTVKAAFDIAKYTSEDPCSGLADASLMVQDKVDLDLYHPSNLTPEQAIDITKRCEQAAFDTDSKIKNSDGASFSSHHGFRVYGNSHGVLQSYPSSRHSLSCAVIGESGSDMQRDYAYTVSRLMAQLDSPEKVGQDAALETVSRLDGKQLSTGKMPVMFRSDIASGLFGHFIAAISGGNLYRKSSYLLDALNTQVFPEWLTILEDPFIKQGLASSYFDNEGVITQTRNIVEQGVLQTWLMSSYAARKMGLQSTGHAGGIHNWRLQKANQSPANFDAMLQALGTGLLVTELMGQGVNVVTGDYSRGAAGFWVENGKIQYPVQEITIAGNLKDMLQNIVAIGDDIDPRGSIYSGSILLEELQVAGA